MFHPILSEKTKIYSASNIEIQNIDLKLVSLVNKFENATRYTVGKYNIHSKTVNETLSLSEDGDILIINYADFIWSRNSVSAILHKLARDNYDLVLNHPLSIDTKECDFFESEIQRSNNIESSLIVEKSIRQTDWWYKQYEYLNSRGARYKSLIYWKRETVNSIFYIFRGFHLNVLAFRKKTHKGQLLPQIEFGTLDGNYFPYQIKQLGAKEYFMSDLSVGCVGAFTNRDSALYPITKDGFYVSNLHRHAEVHHGKNEINNLKKYMVIFEANFKPEDEDINDLIQQSEFDIRNILEMPVGIINTPDENDLILRAELSQLLVEEKYLKTNLKLVLSKILRIMLDIISYALLTIYICRQILNFIKVIFRMINLRIRLEWKKYFKFNKNHNTINDLNRISADEINQIVRLRSRQQYLWLRALKRGNSNFRMYKKWGINRLFATMVMRIGYKTMQIEKEYNSQ